jgi:hypothetical protein
VAALMLALLAVNPPPASAVPLDPAACEELREKLETLRSDGAAADMARGPDWARANLAPDRLQRIGALLEVEEQLNFRCGIAKARITLPNTIEGGEEEIAGPGEATVEGTRRTIFLPQKAPPAPKRPSAATSEPAENADQARKRQEKSAPPAEKRGKPRKKAPAKKPKPQADDTNRPPRPLASDHGWAPTIHR